MENIGTILSNDFTNEKSRAAYVGIDHYAGTMVYKTTEITIMGAIVRDYKPQSISQHPFKSICGFYC